MKAWFDFVKTQEKSLGEVAIKKWLLPLQIVKFDARNLYLETEDSFKVAWFEEHIRGKLKGFKNNNDQIIQVHIKLLGKEEKKKKKFSFYAPSSYEQDALLPHTTLENFFPTEGTWEAWKICKLLLEKKQEISFNPILLYGPTKVGKTHLLCSLARLLQKEAKKVFYVKADTFTSHVVRAIQGGGMQNFRTTYRNIDTLIVDDIHVFKNKAATQEEFFHTFNTLHTQGKQIILSSLEAPSNLQIEPRLISRFQWGLVLPMHAPKQEELISIIKQRAESLCFPLKEEVLSFLLKKFQKNISLLFRALDALVLRSPKGISCDLFTAQKLLQDLLQEEKTLFTPSYFLEKVCTYFKISKDQLLGNSQKMEISIPRQIAMYLLRTTKEMPFAKIGELFQRDHSTVMSSIRKVEQKISKKDPEILEVLQKIAKEQEG